MSQKFWTRMVAERFYLLPFSMSWCVLQLSICIGAYIIFSSMQNLPSHLMVAGEFKLVCDFVELVVFANPLCEKQSLYHNQELPEFVHIIT